MWNLKYFIYVFIFNVGFLVWEKIFEGIYDMLKSEMGIWDIYLENWD